MSASKLGAPRVTKGAFGELVLAMPGLRLYSEANRRDLPLWVAERTRQQRSATRETLLTMAGERPELPVVVSITRIAPDEGIDDDNLGGACKHVRDGVADWLGVDDRDPRVRWHVASERGPWGTRVAVLSVRPWSLDAPSARVTQHGVVTVVDATLGPVAQRALAEQLRDMGEGRRAASVVRFGSVQVRLHAAKGR